MIRMSIFYFIFYSFLFFPPHENFFIFPITFLFVPLGRQLEAGEKRKEGRKGSQFPFFFLISPFFLNLLLRM